MSKLSQAVKIERRANHMAVNFMGGISYELNPLDTMKMVTASSIFGEPQYYRDGEFAEKYLKDGFCWVNELFMEYSILPDQYNGMKTSKVMLEKKTYCI